MEPAGARPGHGAQPDRVLGAPHELRPRRAADRAARRLLRRAGRRRCRADHHRGALDAPDGLALREADPRVPPRRHPRLPAHHRGRAPPPRADLRPDQPQRRAGVVDVHAAAGLGAVARRRPAVPGGPEGRQRRRDRRDRRRLRDRGRALRRGRLRRHRAAVQPLVHRARLPLPRHEPPHRRLRRLAGQPDQDPPRDRRRRAPRDRDPPGTRRAAVRRRAHRGRHDHRRSRRGGADRRGVRPRRLRQHVDRRGDGDAVHDRGVDARAARLRAVHPVGDAPGHRPAGRRCRPLQGPAAGGAGARRGSLRPRRRRARPDRRRRLRGQGPRRGHRGDPALPVVQPGVRRADGPEPLARLHREPADGPRSRARSFGNGRTGAVRTHRQAGRRRRRRTGRAAGGDQLRPRRARRHRARARSPSRAARCGSPPACRTGPSSATWCATRSPSAAASA